MPELRTTSAFLAWEVRIPPPLEYITQRNSAFAPPKPRFLHSANRGRKNKDVQTRNSRDRLGGHAKNAVDKPLEVRHAQIHQREFGASRPVEQTGNAGVRFRFQTRNTQLDPSRRRQSRVVRAKGIKGSDPRRRALDGNFQRGNPFRGAFQRKRIARLRGEERLNSFQW